MSECQLTVFYDGDCPMCVKEINWLRKRTKGNVVCYVDICSDGFDASSYGLEYEDFMSEIRAQLPDGQIITGMEVFRRLYSLVGLGWLLRPTGWPLLRPLFDLAYRIFARYRIPVGRVFGRCEDGACRVPPGREERR